MQQRHHSNLGDDVVGAELVLVSQQQRTLLL